MNTKDFLKTELDKIDKNAYYETEGYGNVEFICKVMELYADVVNKKKIEKDKMTRKEYQKKYQKEYADSGKKSEAAKRYYQKHKYEICEKLKNKRKNLQIEK